MKSHLAMPAVLMALSLVLCSCATAPPPVAKTATPAADSANTDPVLLVYRPARIVGFLVAPDVYLDGQKMARLEVKQYAEIRTTAGKHQVALRSNMWGPMMPEESKSFEARAGRHYYFKYLPAAKDVLLMGYFKKIDHLFQMDETTALKEMKCCQKIER